MDRSERSGTGDAGRENRDENSGAIRPVFPVPSFPSRSLRPYGITFSIFGFGSSFQFTMELNTMLNSPWFCQR